ncbi:hypothetical protein LINGRAHAP2_LOCUS18756, partial [Linum grandiflorum]
TFPRRITATYRVSVLSRKKQTTLILEPPPFRNLIPASTSVVLSAYINKSSSNFPSYFTGMASFGEAQESKLPSCLRNKNLYLGYASNTTIFGIEIEDGLDLVGKTEPAIIKNPVILGEWSIHKHEGLPLAMPIVVKDSKVYGIGGSNHGRDKSCHILANCLEESSPSKLVYEFTPRSRRTFSPCSSVPQLPVGMSSPVILNHMGEIYVIHAEQDCNQCWLSEIDDNESVVERCFLVLRKDGTSWEYLPRPPPGLSLCSMMLFYGVIGNTLYVRGGIRLFGYHFTKKQWEVTTGMIRSYPWIDIGSITLSSLSTTGQSSYVVIYILDDSEGGHWHRICAALVDEDGKEARSRQVIFEATGDYDRIGTFKLIELESDEDSSTFAMVFTPRREMIGLTVVRVSLLPRWADGNEFLKGEVLVNQRYDITGKRLACNGQSMYEAFFY